MQCYIYIYIYMNTCSTHTYICTTYVHIWPHISLHGVCVYIYIHTHLFVHFSFVYLHADIVVCPCFVLAPILQSILLLVMVVFGLGVESLSVCQGAHPVHMASSPLKLNSSSRDTFHFSA